MHKPTAVELDALEAKTAPVRAGRQKPGSHLVFNGENRKQRRAEAASAKRPVPKSFWLITHVGVGQHIETATPMYQLKIERCDQQDVLFVFSKEGTSPVSGRLLERMARPGGGEAAIWTDGKASKKSIGGGYTFAAVPAELGFPEPEIVLDPAMQRFENLTLGMPWKGAAS